jgi:hypothetical protein
MPLSVRNPLALRVWKTRVWINDYARSDQGTTFYHLAYRR